MDTLGFCLSGMSSCLLYYWRTSLLDTEFSVGRFLSCSTLSHPTSLHGFWWKFAVNLTEETLFTISPFSVVLTTLCLGPWTIGRWCELIALGVLERFGYCFSSNLVGAWLLLLHIFSLFPFSFMAFWDSLGAYIGMLDSVLQVLGSSVFSSHPYFSNLPSVRPDLNFSILKYDGSVFLPSKSAVQLNRVYSVPFPLNQIFKF